MEPEIKNCGERKLVGHSCSMSLAEYSVGRLWAGFMPHRKEIPNALNRDLISLTVYSPGHFSDFDPRRPFEKWALVEVPDFSRVPDGMKTFLLEDGPYAVFHYKGAAQDHRFFEYILREWMPQSEFELADRPHFEILGENYKVSDPAAQEDIWIPVQRKQALPGEDKIRSGVEENGRPV